MVSTHLWLTRTIATLMLVAVAGTAYASNPAYGIVTQAFDRSMEMRTVQSGAGSVRLDLDWDRLETADNYYEPNYVNEILSNLARAEAHGLHVYLTIAYTPGWANGNQPHQYPPTDYNKWQEVLQDIFFVLGDRPNLTFGIWNEPDLPQFLVDDSAATNWKQLWYRAHVARFNVGKPYIKLGGPDHTGYGPRLGYFSQAVGWMMAHGQPQDVITVHWYTDHPNSLPSLISIATTASNPKQVWLTEVGSDRSDDIVQSNQLQNLVFIPFNGRGTGSLWAKIFVYRMTPYLSMGLLRSDGTARPSFSTFQFYSGGPLGPSVNVTLQAVNGWKYGSNGYVVAENGGGGAVNANRWSPGPWETFGLWDWNGGSVHQHGDVVSFMTGTYQYLQPNSGGGGGMTAAGSPYNYGIFSIHRVAGPGAVAPGDIVYLQTLSGHYVVAEGGGGSVVNANRTSVGEWEQFRIAP